jgi:Subtilase family
MKIAIIDSGINAGHPHVGGVAGGVWITPSGACQDYVDRLGHGTAIAGAIRDRAPGAELLAVKVFDRSLAAGIAAIIRAMEWSIDQQADIINLSLGATNPDHGTRFKEVLARSPHVVVVSACEREGRQLLPGSLPAAIGVVLDRECPRNSYRVEMRGGRRAHGSRSPVDPARRRAERDGGRFVISSPGMRQPDLRAIRLHILFLYRRQNGIIHNPD